MILTIFAIVSLVTTFSFIGCKAAPSEEVTGTSAAETTTAKETAVSKETTAAEETVEAPELKGEIEIFSWWTAGADGDALAALIDAFSEKYPTVEVINAAVGSGGAGIDAKPILVTRVQGGNPPDTFQVHAGHELIDTWVVADLMEPVTFLFDENDWREVYPGDLIEILSYNGEIWSVPLNIMPANILWYNKKIFEDAGLNPPKTIDEFYSVCETLKENGITPMAYANKGSWANAQLFEVLLAAIAGPDNYKALFNGAMRWDSDEVKETLNTMLKFIEYSNEDHAALEWDNATELVANGKAAMYISGDWCNGYFKKLGLTPGEDYGFVPSPGTEGIYIALSDSFGLPKGIQNRPATVEWLKFIGSKEAQDIFNPIKGSIPPRTDCDKSEYDAYQQYSMEIYSTSKILPSLTHGAAASEPWLVAIEDVLVNFVVTGDIEGTAAELQRVAEDVGTFTK
ncbi:MAG: extracellular solute-binding protein [Actinobacteria bacterium]|nr:extracellular solute-binding protein [Actinomycetota bacterium]